MKRKMTILRYLLYGILFLPAAYLLCGVTSLPFWRNAVSFQNERMLTVIMVIGFFMIGAGFAFIASLMAWLEYEDNLDSALEIIAVITCVLAGGVLVPLWMYCLGASRSFGAFFMALLLPFAGMFAAIPIYLMSEDAWEDGVRGAWIPGLSFAISVTLSGLLNFAYLLLLNRSPGEEELFARIDFSVAERLDAFAALGGLVMFVILTRLGYRKRLLDLCQYPSDRRILRREAETSRDWERRLKALNLLPYPQEREILVQIARNDKKTDVRKAALKRLTYPEERETIAWIALNDEDTNILNIRVATAKLLPYPQEREILERMARNDKKADVRVAAAELLPYPQAREILERIALNDKHGYVRKAAREKLDRRGR